MDLLHFSAVRFLRRRAPPPRPLSSFPVRSSSLPFPIEKAMYHRELEAAVNVVQKACSLCVDVKKSLLSNEARILEKNDNTPVTVADFGVQALVSLELSKLFPTIPLVAEEDSGFLRTNNLVDSVVSVVTNKASSSDKTLTHADVLEAIDRGGKKAIIYGTKPATYWILDPIDGTKGFLKGCEALYVVGLSLMVEDQIVLGVMGCPNWKEIAPDKSKEVPESESGHPTAGVIMVAHLGCGTWTKKLPSMLGRSAEVLGGWSRCFVDACCSILEARFCIPDSQTWEIQPLSRLLNATDHADSIGDKEILLLPGCCGSLCKYMMVASGKASVFIQKALDQKVIKAWDHAVGTICVQEAGGKVTDWKGSQLDLTADQVERRIIFPADGVLVTNGKIHNQILDMISSAI